MQQGASCEQIENEIVFVGEEPYFFAPSITKKRTIKGKTYIVRSFFKGGKDFNETIKKLAIKQAYKK